MKLNRSAVVSAIALFIAPACPAAVYVETGGRVVIEAEHFDSRTTASPSRHHWHIVPDEDGLDELADFGDPPFVGARGDRYMQVLPVSGLNYTGANGTASAVGNNPYLDYKVLISTPGTYRLFLRWNGYDGGSDSMYAQVLGIGDGIGGIPDWYRFSRGSNLDFSANSWHGNGGPERNDASGGDVAATWEIPTAGVYTIRLSHREDGVAVDALVFQRTTLAAPGEPGPDESATTTAFPPFAKTVNPSPGSRTVAPDSMIRVELEEGDRKVDPASIQLKLNGTAVTPTVTKDGAVTTIVFTPAVLFQRSSQHTVELVYKDTATPPSSYNLTWSFGVEDYAILSSDLAIPASQVDTTAPGFIVRVAQTRQDAYVGLGFNSTIRAEDQLAGRLIDWQFGRPHVNNAARGPNPDGTYSDLDVINWNQDAPGAVGNFSVNSTPPAQDEPIPGINPGENNFIAAEILTYIEFSAGLHRLGVNSDDGFRVTSGATPKDAAGPQLGVFSGGRGAADTIFNVVVESAGIYPIRLIWYEGDGGANLEFFSVNRATGQRVLINDRANPAALKAYRRITGTTRPYARSAFPLPDSVNVNPSASIAVELLDQSTRIAPNSIRLVFNGAPVPAEVSKVGEVTTVTYRPPDPLPSGSRNEVALTFSDDATPAVTRTSQWDFSVMQYGALPTVLATFALPASAVDLTKPGFVVRVDQMPVGRPGGNDLPAPENQLAGRLIDPATGVRYENIAFPGPNADGSYFDEDYINWNQNDPGAHGNFRPDETIPGIPGFNGTTDNIAAELLTILDLKQGIYQFGVNSDDGFLLSAAADARDQFPVQLGLFNGGRGAADSIFAFRVEKDGLYPFRLIWWEGGGDANLEFFSLDRTTGRLSLINDRSDPSAIRAYRVPAAAINPFVQSINPLNGTSGVPAASPIQIKIADGTLQVAPASIQLAVNGQTVVPQTSKAAGVTTISYDPRGTLRNGDRNSVRLTYADNASPPSSRTIEFSFITQRDALPPNTPPIEQGADGLAVVESENFDANTAQGVHAWVFDQTPAGYSGTGTMYSLPESGANIGLPGALTDSPRLDYRIKFVKTGTHYLWIRGADGGGDSIHAGINDLDPTGTNLDNIDEPDCCGPRAPGGVNLVWINGTTTAASGRSTFEVPSAGVHTIRFWMREDGQILDKFLITTDPNYAPAGAGPAESKREGQTLPPQFNPPQLQGGNLVLSWTGTGTLQQADSVTGPWSNAASQVNPQTIPVSAAMRFYRLRQ